MATQVQEYELKIHKDSLKAESFFPGISYDDFDRAGGISPWKILRMFESGRMIPFARGNFIDFNQLVSRNYGFFVLGGDYYFDPCLWDVARKYLYFPYKVSIEIINRGQSSLTIRQVLTNTLDGKEVATCYAKLVYVDKVARKAVAFPYWHRQKFGHLQAKTDDLAKVVLGSDDKEPEGAFKTEVVVVPSDTDHNGHTNQGSYIRFCLDAAEVANKAGGVLTCAPGDVCLHPILKMTVNYKGETNRGDRLVISVWQDDLSPPGVHFTMRRQGKEVFTSTITFKWKPSAKM